MKKILIIDDDKNLVSMMAETLQFMGFETVAAQNGVLGIEMAVQQTPDLILCDLNMPLRNGIETLKTLRQTESIAKIPFILLSGDVEGTRKKAQEMGANGIIAKPFSIAEIMSRVNFALKEAA